MRKSEEERGAGAEEKRVRGAEWGERTAVLVRVAGKGVSGNWGCARERVSAGRLGESGEPTTKKEYHRSYGEVKGKERRQQKHGRRDAAATIRGTEINLFVPRYFLYLRLGTVPDLRLSARNI